MDIYSNINYLLLFISIINNILRNKSYIKYQDSIIKYNKIFQELTHEFKEWFVGFLDTEGNFL